MAWPDLDPHVRIRWDGAASTLEPLAGLSLNYSTSDLPSRRCLGHKPFRGGNWVDCDNDPLPDGRTCDRCAANDATFASQLHHAHTRGRAELDKSVLQHLDKANELYLAVFGDGSLKVGTSTAPRLRTRLTEQGAWRARVVATASDGFAVRSIEDRVTTALGLPQAVSMRRKLTGLERPRPMVELERELDLWTERVHELVDSSGDDRLTSVAVDWEGRPANASLPMLLAYPRSPAVGNHALEFVDAVGRAVIARRPDGADRFVFDLQALYGIELTLGDHEPDELTIQDSLF